MLLSRLLQDYTPTNIPADVFREFNDIDVTEYTQQDKNRGVDYISWSIAQYLALTKLQEKGLAFVPVVLLTDYCLPFHQLPIISDGDESIPCGGYTVVALINSVDKTYVGLTWSPIMAKNKMNSCVTIPDARQIADSVQRAMVKSIAVGTGIGFSLFTRFEFDEEKPPAKQEQRQRTKPVEFVQDEDEYDDDDEDPIIDEDLTLPARYAVPDKAQRRSSGKASLSGLSGGQSRRGKQ